MNEVLNEVLMEVLKLSNSLHCVPSFDQSWQPPALESAPKFGRQLETIAALVQWWPWELGKSGGKFSSLKRVIENKRDS